MSADSERPFPPAEPTAFESLCLDLWKSIWGDAGAKKNGRSGQPQAGVDVFGQMAGEWVGVQCKQRDGQARSKVTIKELESEVSAALNFEPKLRAFILATTALADANLQRRARELADEHRAKGLFTVEVWSWEKIWHEIYGRENLLRCILPVYWPRLCQVLEQGAIDGARRVTALFTLPNTHRSNPNFIRCAEVESALDSLECGDILVLHGLAGVGKTQQAVQYAHVHHTDFSNVLWISATTTKDLWESLAALAGQLNLPLPFGIHTPLAEKLDAVRAWLAREMEWLLLIDNANSEPVAREIEQFLPSLHQGRVLITSQLTEWTPAFRKQRMEVWDNRQSVLFLKQRLMNSSRDEHELANLAGDLGGLPLVLEHAAAYINETRVCVSQYRRLLTKDHPTILRRQCFGTTDYRASVAQTWQVAVNFLSFLPRYILGIAACLASTPIPRRILEHLLSSASDDFTLSRLELIRLRRSLLPYGALDRALADLARYSLISLSEDAFSLHPLLQLVVRDSARLRLWHYRYRFWGRVSRVKDKAIWNAALWPQRAARLLYDDGVLPWSTLNDNGLLRMELYPAHLDAVLGQLCEETFGRSIVYMRLKHLLSLYRSRIDSYDASVAAICTLLRETAELAEHLKSETEWFISQLDDLYDRAPNKGIGSDLTCRMESASRAGSGWTIYDFLRHLAGEQAKLGEFGTARRLFRFCFKHAIADPKARRFEAGRTRVDESFVMVEQIPIAELVGMLEEGLKLLESDVGPLNYIWMKGVLLYSLCTQTPEQRTRAFIWLNKTIPASRTLLEHGLAMACQLTSEHVRLLPGNADVEEALKTLGETLRAAIRSRRIARESLAPLWKQRGDLLERVGDSKRAARCYARYAMLAQRKSARIRPTAGKKQQMNAL